MLQLKHTTKQSSAQQFKNRLIAKNLIGNIRLKNILNNMLHKETREHADNIHSCVIKVKHI